MAAFCHQLVMSAALDYLSVVNDDYHVCMADSGKAVSYYEGCSAF